MISDQESKIEIWRAVETGAATLLDELPEQERAAWGQEVSYADATKIGAAY